MECLKDESKMRSRGRIHSWRIGAEIFDQVEAMPKYRYAVFCGWISAFVNLQEADQYSAKPGSTAVKAYCIVQPKIPSVVALRSAYS